jgi:hypothetical protein
MSRKPQISFRVSADDVPQKVSGEFKRLIQSGRLTDPEYTVVSFSGMKGNSTSIVDSKNLIKALEKCESRTDRIIVAAHDFTLDEVHLHIPKKTVSDQCLRDLTALLYRNKIEMTQLKQFRGGKGDVIDLLINGL